ncbi:MAG: T9SS type A sorting domain-containing protein [Lewinellaceae bacterium]|nr:T9SS type A sorting domain-containing protein [Lewinellaceae bacterium]
MVTQENTYEWVPGVNDWNPTQSISYEYDNAERLAAKETAFIHAGIPDVKERVTYAYIEDEYLALETSYTWDITTAAFILDERTYYYYAGGVLSVSPGAGAAQVLMISPNPTTDAIQFRLETEAEVRIFDAAGQLLQSGIVQPGETMYLTTLPTGMYYVTAQHGAQFYTGKVLKI